jgi:cysteine-rich repeat protein
MLDQFTKAHRKTQRRRLGPAALFSIAAHVAALIALLGVAAWRVEKLKPVDPPILLAAGFGALPDTGSEEEEPVKPEKPKKPKRKVDVPVQPEEPTTEEAADDPGEGADGEPGNQPGGGAGGTCLPGQDCQTTAAPPQPVCGNGQVESGEQCDDGGQAAGDGCSATCRTEREAVVVSKLIEGHRIAGDPQIPAPDSVRLQMVRAGEKRAVGAVKMCLTREGTVRSLAILRSTGYSEYDQLLLGRMRGWLYRPYELSSGARVPVCTVVTFIYQLR